MQKNDRSPQQDYNEVYFSLRAPRVAIVFPADTPHWGYFARQALWQANQLWGGAGFVLVAHHDGVVSDTVLRAVAAYDPDYVVSHRVSWNELLTAYPAARDMFVGPDGAVSNFDLANLNKSADAEAAMDPRTLYARDQVALACQVYRRLDDSDPAPPPDPKKLVRWDQTWRNSDESSSFLDDSRNLSSTAVFGKGDSMCLAAPPGLGGAWGAWTAALVGAVAKPDLPSVAELDGSGGGPEPLSPDAAAEMAGWFYSQLERPSPVVPQRLPARLVHHHAGLKLGVDTTTLSPAWSRTTPGLVSVGDNFARRRITVVVGNTADDFALALIYHRLYGNTLWIHAAWSPINAGAGKAGRRGNAALSLLGYRIRQLGRAVVTSASVSGMALDAIANLISRNGLTDNDDSDIEGFVSLAEQPGQSSPTGSSTGDAVSSDDADDDGAAATSDTNSETNKDDDRDGDGDKSATVTAHGSAATARRAEHIAKLLTTQFPAQFPQKGMLNLAVTEEYSTRMTLPVLRDEKAATFTTTPPPLRPSDPVLGGVDIAWHVDLHLAGSTMPRGRGLDGEQLAANPDARYETWVRSGNRSVSYESRKYDFVAAGANLEQRLARPRLRSLTLQEWCRGMASQAGYDLGWSDAGRRARLLERMWGSRSAMTADFAGKFTDLARAFSPAGRSSKEAYPDGTGVLVTGVGGLLTFPAIRDVLVPSPHDGNREPVPAVRDHEARVLLDSYITRGIIRRGLVLGCRTCEAPSFVAVADLGQRNRCPRCGSDNELTLEAWRTPKSEPSWFYDLNQVARDFLRDNGHAPIWLAHHLTKTARDYTDCAEMNLYREGTRTSVAETDLIALVDGTLLTAEVKTCDYLGSSAAERSAAAHKRLQWAAVLHADEIVLASAAATWQPASIEAMRTKLAAAINDRTFAPDRTPKLRLINNLGTSDATHTYLDL
ncbi:MULTISPECIES: hypothetical protein [unclassified Nocardioides]|uniref:hypothetical protein n=1 Tax=unclassified Nocardioides TaxID=2615069 RepID=UPI0006F2D9A3|nr:MULTISPECIES: hypothetical protein [unclassified Nocardioides]KQY63503.1 hypothetical protein ASD30_00320 [Nocardioides sp. Root140]KRF17543.1 hypothetical protein ASH02_25105 [Nocardioides sp. Soil796]